MCIPNPACHFFKEQEMPIEMNVSHDETIRGLRAEIQRLKEQNIKLSNTMNLVKCTYICDNQVLHNKIVKQRKEISMLRGVDANTKSTMDLKASNLMAHVYVNV